MNDFPVKITLPRVAFLTLVLVFELGPTFHKEKLN